MRWSIDLSNIRCFVQNQALNTCPEIKFRFFPCCREVTEEEWPKLAKFSATCSCYSSYIHFIVQSDQYKNRVCLKTTRPKDPVFYKFSGCESIKPYKPRYCGKCKDDRCCEPKETQIIDVTFRWNMFHNFRGTSYD